ncbi:MAG TPA: CHASE domain-containing protein [Fibrobacteria bacterium]|nr:CHASE domain-containing protein [Fibrobacteria bacterium]
MKPIETTGAGTGVVLPSIRLRRNRDIPSMELDKTISRLPSASRKRGAWGLLAVGALLSALAAWSVKSDIEDAARREFDFASDEIRLNITARLAANAQILYGGAALFNTLDSVTRSDWKTFSRSLPIDRFVPGTQGFGFTLLVPEDQLERHLRAIRREGFPDYAIHPAGKRDPYSAIVFLEPFVGRNLRAFGYDMYSEPVRREAMERARDSNLPALSGKVTLVQETSNDVQAGTLMYMPVYRRGLPTETVEQRRAAILGWIYSPYRMTDLMRGTLRGWDVKRENHPIALRIHDGDSLSPESLLYDSRNTSEGRFASEPHRSRRLSLDVAGRRWTLVVMQLGKPDAWNEFKSAWIVLLGGTIISALLFGLARSLANTGAMARQMAQRLTREMRELTDRLSLATRAGGVGIWDYDVVQGTLHWDDQMHLLYGTDPSRFENVYEAWRSGVHPDDRERSDAEIRMALRGEKEFDTEFRVTRPDGEIRHVRALALVQRDAAGKALHLIGTNWDITEQKVSEEALREKETRISQLLQTTDQGIYGIDTEGRCTFINQSGLRMLGFELDECLGMDMHDLVHHSHPDGSRYPVENCPIFRAKLTGHGSRVDTESFWRKDGTSFPADYSSYPIFEGETIRGAVVTFSDITGRKQAEQALLAANAELQEATVRANALALQAEKANVAKSEFLATMSHEIRTPMNGVMGLTGLLLDTELTDEQRRLAEIIRQSGESLLAIINDILDFSKIEAGRLELESLDFDLRSLLEDVADNLFPRIREKGLEFVRDISPDLPRSVRGDPGRLRQILTNLLGNAIKFTERGRIALIAEPETESGEGTMARFRVQDTGIGIPADKRKNLFQKFMQVDSSNARQYGGTGLGLAISKQLTELMGGRIGILSKEGEGSEFWFTVRFTEASGAGNSTSGASPGPFPSKAVREGLRGSRPGIRRILLAEDNTTNQMVALGILGKMGLRADAVADGREALVALEQFPYDLVLMDLQMPEMDGLEATRRIRDPRSGVRDHDIPIVAMTANAMQGDRERCLEAGMNDYVSKPISPGKLAEALDRWLPRSPRPAEVSAPISGEDGCGTAPEAEALDWTAFVARVMGDQELAWKIADAFRKECPGIASRLRSSIEAGDANSARQEAHSIKGASANIGADALGGIARRLEEDAISGDLDALRSDLPRLDAELERVLEALENRRP